MDNQLTSINIDIKGFHAGENTRYAYRVYLSDIKERVYIDLGGFTVHDVEILTSFYSKNIHDIAKNDPNRFLVDTFFNSKLPMGIYNWHGKENLRKVAYFISDMGRCPSANEYKKMKLMEALR